MSIDADSRPELAVLDVPHGEALPDFMIDDGHWLGDAAALRGVVLPIQDEGRVRRLLEMESPCVYVGAAALTDSGIVERLVQSYGSGRVGVFASVARMEVSWTLETQSNADFKTVMPSRCAPAWEILDAQGGRTGAELQWWLDAMFERGASSAIVAIDMHDDDDLNICAALVEAFGDKLWFAPRSVGGNHFDDWVRWGKVSRLALPFAARQSDAGLWQCKAAEDPAACASA